MMEELKRRIKMINRGEAPDGYKRTESGIVPVEWKETMLRNLLDFKNGINADKEKFGSGIKLISVMDILDNSPITYESIRGAVDIDKETLEKYSVTYGDILFQRSSENFDDAGKSNVYLDKNNTATYSGFVIRGKKIAEYDPFYLNELLKTQDVRKQIIRLSAGSQHINIGQESLSQINLNIADIPEQQKIAEILMKWDDAVTLQEKLVEKLEVKRVALMQKLLTPQREWKVVRLGDICEITTGKLDVNAMDEDGEYPFFTCAKEQFRINKYAFDTEAILISGNGANVGYVHYYKGKFNAYQRTYVLDRFKLNINFVQYSLDKNLSKRIQMEKNTGNTPYIVLSTLTEMKISYPTTDMQVRIAGVLEKDERILKLQKQKLAKLKEQQKAIMHLLLTGIIRVNNA
jgi:type I restriction enzyme S subunit